MSGRRGTQSKNSSVLAARDIPRAREFAATAAPGPIKDVLVGIRDSTLDIVDISDPQTVMMLNNQPLLLGALFVLLQVNHSVRSFTMTGVDMGESWLIKLVSAALTVNQDIESLQLEECEIDAAGAEILMTAFARNVCVKSLSLNGNKLGDEGAQHVAMALRKNMGLSVVSLEDNHISDSGVCHIAHSLEVNDSLKIIFFGGNEITFGSQKYFDEELRSMLNTAQTLARALSKNSTLQVLDIRHNAFPITSEMGPVFEALKTNTTIKTVGLAENSISNRAMLYLAEMCHAAPTIQRTVDLSRCGVNARVMREVCAIRMASHSTTFVGIDMNGISNVEELTAQTTFIAHIVSRRGASVFPSDTSKQYVLLDGRLVILKFDGRGSFAKGQIVYGHGDTFHFSVAHKSVKMQSAESIGKSYSLNAADVMLVGTYEMADQKRVSLPKLVALMSGGLALADYGLDVKVLYDLASGDEWTSFYIALGILLISLAYVCYALWTDGRPIAAALHPFGVAVLIDVFNVVVLGHVNSARIPLRTSQPIQGYAAIQRLKLTEALLEAAPQIILQSYIVLKTSVTLTLGISLALSFMSITTAITQSDRQKLVAWSKAQKLPPVSPYSFAIPFIGLFRALEVASNVGTISVMMATVDTYIAGAVLGGKFLLTIIYWRGNLRHIGEVVSSLLVSPGTERITYDWVKDTTRLPTLFYVGLQIICDIGILLALAVLPQSNARDKFPQLYNAAIGIVLMKYVTALLLLFLHTRIPDFMYSDRRHIYSCGLIGKKIKTVNTRGQDLVVNGRTVHVAAEAAKLLRSSAWAMEEGKAEGSVQQKSSPKEQSSRSRLIKGRNKKSSSRDSVSDTSMVNPLRHTTQVHGNSTVQKKSSSSGKQHNSN